MQEFLFADEVIVESDLVGVIVKTWIKSDNTRDYEVYVRSINCIKLYPENEIQRYRVKHKYLDDKDMAYQSMDLR